MIASLLESLWLSCRSIGMAYVSIPHFQGARLISERGVSLYLMSSLQSMRCFDNSHECLLRGHARRSYSIQVGQGEPPLLKQSIGTYIGSSLQWGGGRV